MKLIVFDIKGKFAHFRKFYTNSSSMTYEMIPRTTLMGIVAAMLGYPRDSYYEKLSSSKMNITCKKLTETYKIMQTLNYIRATSETELITQKEHTQVPFQVLTGKDGVSYRVYLNIDDDSVMHELEDMIKTNKFIYSPTFGTANFNTLVKYVGTFEVSGKIEEYTKIEVPIIDSYIEDIRVKGSITKERMIKDFDTDRNSLGVHSYIYSTQSEFKLNTVVYDIKEISDKIVFL